MARRKSCALHYSNVRGTGTYDYAFEGVINTLRRRYNETSEAMRAEFEEYMTNIECPDCHGKRLRPEVLAITVNGKNISEVTELSIGKMQEFFQSLTLTERENMIAERILKEIHARVGFLIDVGLEYLTLSQNGRHAFRWGIAAYPSGNADWLRSGRRSLYSG